MVAAVAVGLSVGSHKTFAVAAEFCDIVGHRILNVGDNSVTCRRCCDADARHDARGHYDVGDEGAWQQ